MKGTRYNYITVYLFLALFLSTKMAGLHVLTHESDSDHLAHCITCELAVINNLTPVIPAEPTDFACTNVEIVVQNEATVYIDVYIDQSITPDQLFTRPPPFSRL